MTWPYTHWLSLLKSMTTKWKRRLLTAESVNLPVNSHAPSLSYRSIAKLAIVQRQRGGRGGRRQCKIASGDGGGKRGLSVR